MLTPNRANVNKRELAGSSPSEDKVFISHGRKEKKKKINYIFNKL